MSSPKPSCITWGGLEMLFARIDLDSDSVRILSRLYTGRRKRSIWSLCEYTFVMRFLPSRPRLAYSIGFYLPHARCFGSKWLGSGEILLYIIALSIA